ncbi:MAG: hypothetical protein ACT4PK_04970 [Gammaproteobacteria bacterium]
MLRKLLVYLFIVTSLSAQARVAFACDMMGKVMDDCCCEEMQALRSPEQPSVGAADACCTPVTVVDADQAGTSDTAKSAVKALNPDLQPQPVAVAPIATPFAVARKLSTSREVPPESMSRPGTLTYLSTLRLRI